MASQSPTILTEESIDDFLYFARTADISELKLLLDETAKATGRSHNEILVIARDAQSGNTMLHMAAANGHADVITLLLSLAPTPSTQAISTATTTTTAMPTTSSNSTAGEVPFIDLPNNAGNTPLHWAAVNGHLDAVKALVDAGADLMVKNAAGHDVAFEAELAGKEDVVNWLLGVEGDVYGAGEGDEAEGEDIQDVKMGGADGES